MGKTLLIDIASIPWFKKFDSKFRALGVRFESLDRFMVHSDSLVQWVFIHQPSIPSIKKFTTFTLYDIIQTLTH